MKRWSYVPPNETIWKGLRKHDVTSTESAALFGMSPYMTFFQLYYNKREKVITEIDMNERMLWGKFMENTIARGIAAINGVKVRRMTSYIRIVDARMGSSFDFEIIGLIEKWDGPDTPLRAMYREHGVGVFEIKAVDYLVFRDKWETKDDGTIEAPQHIEIQAQHQLHVSGRKWSAIGVLVSGHTPKILVRNRFADVGDALEFKVRQLWKRIAANDPPPPDYPEDADFVKKLYGYADPGKVYDASEDGKIADLADQYADALKREKLAKEDKTTAQAEIYRRIGEAERIIHPKFSLWSGSVGPSHIEAYDRDGYRGFKLIWKKEKKANG